MSNLPHLKIDESLLIPQEEKRLLIHQEKNPCKELTCVFCSIILFCSSFIIIYLEIINQELNDSNSTTDMDLNR